MLVVSLLREPDTISMDSDNLCGIVSISSCSLIKRLILSPKKAFIPQLSDESVNSEFKINNWTINPALRLDYFKFNYVNNISETHDNHSQTALAFSPVVNTIFSPNANWQLFLKSGIGFHSNDTRVVIANEADDILPAAYGLDIGTIVKPISKFC